MTITPKGRLLFSVTSVGRRNSLNTYTVDMEENKGLGACSCEHYDYRLRQIKGRCKHMSAVLEWLGEAVVARHCGTTRDKLYGKKG